MNAVAGVVGAVMHQICRVRGAEDPLRGLPLPWGPEELCFGWGWGTSGMRPPTNVCVPVWTWSRRAIVHMTLGPTSWFCLATTRIARASSRAIGSGCWGVRQTAADVPLKAHAVRSGEWLPGRVEQR